MTDQLLPEFEFDRAIAVRPVTEGGDGPGPATWAFEVDPGFTVGPKPNGGYLLAVAARAAGEALAAGGSGHRDPLAATAHYLRAPDPGPATVVTEVLRTGRSASQVRATIRQDDRPCVDVVLTVGTLAEAEEAEPELWSRVAPVALPPIDECFRLPASREGSPFVVPIMDRVDLLADPGCLGFALGQPSGQGELRGWLRFADGRPIDPLALLFLLDVFPPASFDIARSGWVPTLSLTAYLRARPAPGPLRAVQRVQVLADDRLDEVCELWDATGRLVGHATQLAAIRIDEGVEIVPPPPSGQRS
jgi:acyl-coenzyme A thioesterase PaaI-like protein